jgi:hypothetical protein
LPIAFFSAGTCSNNFSNLTPVKLSSTGGYWLAICVRRWSIEQNLSQPALETAQYISASHNIV